VCVKCVVYLRHTSRHNIIRAFVYSQSVQAQQGALFPLHNVVIKKAGAMRAFIRLSHVLRRALLIKRRGNEEIK
jgi:hypothetical protein